MTRASPTRFPPMIEVDSSAIEAIGYRPETRELFVRFRESGHLYVYYDVDFSAYAALLAADSKGEHFNYEIAPRFRYERVNF